MITLDLTNYKGKKPDYWPANTPDKIRLTRGKYQKEYDIHSSERRKAWYKEIIKLSKKEYHDPPYKYDWPIGVNEYELPDGVKIIER